MSEDLISREKAYEVLTEYYHHKTEMQHKALREALDRVPSAELQPTCNKIATSCNQLATDCISRQAAIEALRRAEALTKAFGYHNVIETIRDLPTADIDLSDYSDRLWRNAYERGKADAEPRWIPVTERLPENEQDVLVTVNDGCTHVEIDYFTGTHFLNYWDEVLAWMPLPEPWEGEADA